jgi:5-methylthioadenosine/S-adenosylhomocysteine deaminase
MKLITAWAVLPVSGPPILRNAAVVVDDGRIVAVGAKSRVMKSAGDDPEVIDLGESVLIPGVINAHTHLDQAWLGHDTRHSGDFISFFETYRTRRHSAEVQTVSNAADEAIAFMKSRGTVAVGDASSGTWTVPVLARHDIHATVSLELDRFRAADAESTMERAAEQIGEMERARDEAGARERISIGLSPHGAHTTSGPLLKALAGRASATDSSMSIHISESEAERAFLVDGSGELSELLRRIDEWDDSWKAPGLSTVDFLDRLGVLSARTIAVHCVHLNQQDLSRLQAREVAVVVCPRSNAVLGTGTAPVPRILGSGIPVALGTESPACTPDLDIFAEMAALRADHPGISPAAILRMATLNGARVLGLDQRLGSLDPGKIAVMVSVPLPSPDDDPLEVVTSNPEVVTPVIP